MRSFARAQLQLSSAEAAFQTSSLRGGVLREASAHLTSLTLHKLELGALSSWLKLLSLQSQKGACLLELSKNRIVPVLGKSAFFGAFLRHVAEIPIKLVS